jgi:predicted RNA-binding Zn ribbon-like protein
VVTKPATEIVIVGGSPAIDLANTLDGPRDAPTTGDHLHDYGVLVAWAQRVGVIDAPPPAPSADAGERLLARVKDLRAAVDATFRALATGGEPPRPALDAILGDAAEALANGTLTPTCDGFAVTWDDTAPERVLWPFAHDAAELLRHGPLDRLKVCVECRWMFLDASRNHSRRWCTMSECGGRTKMQRYRARRANG